MLFAEVVATSAAVAATSARNAKRDAIAELLARLDAGEVEPAVGFLTGEPRQGRIGVGWATLSKLERSHADDPSLTIDEVDRTITELAAATGPGSVARRQGLLGDLFGRATDAEATFLVRLLGGELRQGALAGVMADAVARAADLPATVVRRATMLGGRLDATARLALTEGRAGLEAVGLEPGRALQPMLASTAGSTDEAIEAIGEAAVEWKLDGIRVQVHRIGDDVTVYTRNLNDITDRLPGVVDVVRAMPAHALVLDGEAMAFDESGRPHLFQDTVSWRERPGSTEPVVTPVPTAAADEPAGPAPGLRPFFFDLLHVDGRDLVDEPLAVRRTELARVAGEHRIPGTITSDPSVAEAVLAEALAEGHEGVVVKDVASPYEAGRRGKAWRKVKPVHTFDLVVLAVEWGSGRRRGWLSNLHLGARADDGSGFVMVGKTFKGLTDELLRWQTDRFLGLAEREEPWQGPQTGVVRVRPEQVVEIALDGVQRSTRYPGGIALRFARVVRYREDKDAADADLLSTLQGLLPGSGPDRSG